ncbi:UNVERIFIED_CONTAM: hypothetical protein Sradi_0480100 [Sesamum radiatum]|uniref:Polyprotein n=1 Tax=Sesamum radiatum TaxID=300843 RepID=A0AAW2W819_SESRA
MTAQHKRKVNDHENAQIWHARLGHISKGRIMRLVDSKNLEIDDLDHLPTCESCLKEKMTKKPFVGQSVIANGLLDLIHINVCGPLSTLARGGFSYFITFIDDHLQHSYVYLMSGLLLERHNSTEWLKGYTQRHGVDFVETYSPVAMAKSIRILLAIAAWYDYEIWQMNMKTAFLNGFIDGSSVAYVMLYVDDILLIENDVKMLDDIKAWLSTQFSMKNMGEASYILGIKIYRDRSRRMLGLTQSSCIEKVLKRFKMDNSKRRLLPMRHGVKLSKK